LIVVDTSALACIFLREPGFERHIRRLSESEAAFLPVPCYLEFTLLAHLGDGRRPWIDRLIADGPISLAAFEPEHGPIAADAAMTYGRGSGHPARLNFGDCMTYAVAKYRGLPLLYAGHDFQLTDLIAALDPSS
jgi:ribonuclease VapC